MADAGPTHPTVQRNPKLVIQRTVTQDHFAQATQIAGPVQAHAPNVNIVVVPDGVMLGAGGNPAIFVTKQLHVKLVRDGIAAHPQDINVDQALLDVGVNRTVVIKEEVLNYPQARRAAVIWHEYGHAENGPAESGAYLFEVQQLIRAVDENRLQSDEVNEVIESRLDQYAMGMTDPLQTFLDGWKRRRAGEWPYNE